MSNPLLFEQYSGPLRVIIKGVGEFTPNFFDTSLFTYIGHSFGCLTTDLEKNLSVETKPDDWIVLRFSPEERILEVEKRNTLRIRIIDTPRGPDIPEEIRREWVGVELEVEGPKWMVLSSVQNPDAFFGTDYAYTIPAEIALEALKKKSEKAWQWFNNLTLPPAPVFCFEVASCKII